MELHLYCRLHVTFGHDCTEETELATEEAPRHQTKRSLFDFSTSLRLRIITLLDRRRDRELQINYFVPCTACVMHSFTSKLYYLSEIKHVSSNGFVTKERFSLCLEMSAFLCSHWWSECTYVEKVKMAD